MNDSSRRVCVVVTSYNDARTVEQCLRSIATQKGLDAASGVALFDDGSMDRTVELARHCWTNSIPLNVLTTPKNLGPWPNLNRALDYAAERADWAVVLHADDWAEPGWLAGLRERLEACPEDVASISCSWNVVFDGGRFERGENADTAFVRIDGGAATVNDTLMRGCWWKLSGAAIRTRAYRDIGDFDGGYPQCGDWEWLLRALQKGWAIEYIPRALVNYRQHAGTMSTRALGTDVEVMDSLKLLERYGGTLTRGQRMRFLVQRGRFLVRRFGRALLRRDLRRSRSAVRTSWQVARAFGRIVF